MDAGPARLYALLAGLGLALLGVFGFFYDGSFGTGTALAGDDVAGTLIVNGWRNVLYLASGIMALALAPRRPRATALGLGAAYLAFGFWGLAVTERGIGSIADVMPIGDTDNLLHLIIGGLGLGAALIDGPLPAPSGRLRPRRGRRSARRGRGERGDESGRGDEGRPRSSPETD